MSEHIVLIGAGSAMFTRGLIADLIRSGEEVDLALVDIDPLALEVAERLAHKMVSLGRAPITVRADVGSPPAPRHPRLGGERSDVGGDVAQVAAHGVGRIGQDHEPRLHGQAREGIAERSARGGRERMQVMALRP